MLELGDGQLTQVLLGLIIVVLLQLLLNARRTAEPAASAPSQVSPTGFSAAFRRGQGAQRHGGVPALTQPRGSAGRRRPAMRARQRRTASRRRCRRKAAAGATQGLRVRLRARPGTPRPCPAGTTRRPKASRWCRTMRQQASGRATQVKAQAGAATPQDDPSGPATLLAPLRAASPR
jgi:hypothetical protein